MKNKKILSIILGLICIIAIIGGVIQYKWKKADLQKESTIISEASDKKDSDDSNNAAEEVKDSNTTSEKTATDKETSKEDSSTTNAKKTETTKDSKSEVKSEKWVYKKDGYYLYKTNSDKSKKVKVQTEPIHDYTIVGDTLYYVSTDEGANGISLKSLYKVNLGTGASRKLSDADATRLCVVGDDIYFTKSFEVFTIKTNGTGLTKISKEKDAILQKADKEFVTYTYNDKGKTMKVTLPTKYNKHKIGAVEEVK